MQEAANFIAGEDYIDFRHATDSLEKEIRELRLCLQDCELIAAKMKEAGYTTKG